MPLRRGQCLLFDDTLLHWSDENTSDHPRWAVQIDLVPDTLQLTLGARHQARVAKDVEFQWWV